MQYASKHITLKVWYLKAHKVKQKLLARQSLIIGIFKKPHKKIVQKVFSHTSFLYTLLGKMGNAFVY